MQPWQHWAAVGMHKSRMTHACTLPHALPHKAGSFCICIACTCFPFVCLTSTCPPPHLVMHHKVPRRAMVYSVVNNILPDRESPACSPPPPSPRCSLALPPPFPSFTGRLTIELFDDIIPMGTAHLRNRCLPGSRVGLAGASVHKLVPHYAAFLGRK